MVVGGGWVGAFERTRWGSVVIAVVSAVTLVLLMRIHQIWPGGFA
jgi:dolichol kinase